MAGRPRAAVDSGTNTTRLLVVDAAGEVLVRTSTVTRLGAGVDATGHLDDAALARTLDVIAGYRDRWEAAGVARDAVRIAATSAVRDAADRDRYFDGVRARTGVEAEVLSGTDEATMSFVGAVSGVDPAHPTIVIDIGGGSTELVVGDDGGGLAGSHSMQVGAVRVTERHLAGDPPSAAEVGRARDMVGAAIDDAVDDLVSQGADLARLASGVGVAGTITTLAALVGGFDDAESDDLHGRQVSADDVHDWTERLLVESVDQRRARPAIAPGRVDVIAAGALVLDLVVARFGLDSVTVSIADILDGLVAAID